MCDHIDNINNIPLQSHIHCVSKKRANFETVYLKIIRFDFDDIWQKYSKGSSIEFVCFSFRVGLLFIKMDPYNFELYRFKVYAFFRDTVYTDIL